MISCGAFFKFPPVLAKLKNTLLIFWGMHLLFISKVSFEKWFLLHSSWQLTVNAEAWLQCLWSQEKHKKMFMWFWCSLWRLGVTNAFCCSSTRSCLCSFFSFDYVCSCVWLGCDTSVLNEVCVCVPGGLWMICVRDASQCGPYLLKLHERWSVIALVFQHVHTLFRAVSSPAHFYYFFLAGSFLLWAQREKRE